MKPKLFSPNVILRIHIIRSWTWDVSDDGGKEKKRISRFYPNTPVIHTGIGQRTLWQSVGQSEYKEHASSPPCSNPGGCLLRNWGQLWASEEDMRNLEDLQRETNKKTNGQMGHPSYDFIILQWTKTQVATWYDRNFLSISWKGHVKCTQMESTNHG